MELEDIEPLIWRRVALRTSMSMKAVHRVIQAAMGRLDYHLWEFTANEHKYSMLIPDEPDWNERIKDAAKTKLSALLTTGVKVIGYVYDMGDNWQHRARGLRRLSRLLRVHGKYRQQAKQGTQSRARLVWRAV